MTIFQPVPQFRPRYGSRYVGERQPAPSTGSPAWQRLSYQQPPAPVAAPPAPNQNEQSQEVIQDFTDENPYEDVQTQQRIEAAQAQGRELGTVPIGEAFATGFGLLSGVPGASTLGQWVGSKIPQADPRAGEIGSYSGSTGNVFGQSQSGVSRGYDPITGRATNQYGGGSGDAFNTWQHSYGQLRDAGENIASSALGSFENSVYNVSDLERQQGITPGSKVGATPQREDISGIGSDYYTRSGAHTIGGIAENAPGGGVTFASGNLRTDDTGRVIEAAIPVIDPNTGRETGETEFYSDQPTFEDDDTGFGVGGGNTFSQQVEAESRVGLDAFGGSGDDDGGDDGGK